MVETSSNAQSFFLLGEYQIAKRILEQTSVLSLEEQSLLKRCKAYTEKQLDYLYDSFSDESLDLDARFEIHFLSGDFSYCDAQLERISDKNLLFRYFLSRNQYVEAQKTLENTKKDGLWYYSLGRLYGHQSQYKLCFDAHLKAIGYFIEQGSTLMEYVCKANLANYYHLANQFYEADKLFFEVQEFLNTDYQIPSFLEARMRMNLGHYQLEKASFVSAGENLEKSFELLNHTDSNESLRARLLLGNYYLESGQYKKLIDLLQNVSFNKTYQQLDSLRYITMAKARMGQFEYIDLVIEKMESMIEGALDFHQFYVAIDIIELLFRSSRIKEAGQRLRDHLMYCRDHNETAFWYCLNRWNYLTGSDTHLQASLQYHRINELKIEFVRDLLMKAEEAVKESVSSSGVAYYFQELEKVDLPEIYLYRKNLLKYFSTKNTDSLREMIPSIVKADSIDNKLYLLTVLILSGEASLLDQAKNLFENCSQFLKQEEVNDFIIRNAEKLGFKMVISGASYTAKLIFVDSEKGIVSFEGEVLLEKKKKPVLWELMRFVAGESLRKEEISKKVFGAQSYEPLVHDNTISVNLNRLNKCLPETLRLSQSKGLIVLPRDCIFISN